MYDREGESSGARPSGPTGARQVRFSVPAIAGWCALAALALATPAVAQPCVGGTAGGYPCWNIDLLAQVDMSELGGGGGNDIWGWTDPVTGTEYAIVGRTTGTAFVDLSDPENPVYVGNLPTHSFSSPWRDMKVYQDHVFIVSEASAHGMQVFDLNELRDVANPPVTFSESAHYGIFGPAHNIVINEASGYAYAVGTQTCSGGLHVVDISSPLAPSFVNCFSADGYTHDAQCVDYHGPDPDHQGSEICFNSNEDTLTIVDVTNKANMTQIAKKSYPGSVYTHQGWLTEDQAHFLLDDELDELNFGHNTRTYIWDLADLDDPVMIGHYTGPVSAIDHNQYVLGDHVYQSNYSSGLRILDITGIAGASLEEIAFFDVYPGDVEAPIGIDPPGAGGPAHEEIFEGTWSNYPYYASGIVAVNTFDDGLFILQPHLGAVLGGTTSGLDLRRVVCRNSTMPSVKSSTRAPAASWNCGGAGLAWDPGDKIREIVDGLANSSNVAGTLSGLAGEAVTCLNVTSGQSVSAPPAGGAFDCTAAGLGVSSGDRVRVDVRGLAD